MRLDKRLDKGQPSGTNKSEGTGTPSKPEQSNKNLTDKYTDEDQTLDSHVKTNHENRNTDKNNSTNAGGYRN